MAQGEELIEIDGEYFVWVENPVHKDWPRQKEKVHPQPQKIDPSELVEWIHEDGKMRICRNPKCPVLVKRSLNKGIKKIFCNPSCARAYHARKSVQGKHDFYSKQAGRDQLDRICAIRMEMGRPPVKLSEIKWRYQAHQRGQDEHDNPIHCPSANENSDWKCPGFLNAYSYDESTWEQYHQGGPWPGACLIYAVLKDNYLVAQQHASGKKEATRTYTKRWGTTWRWKDEEHMLPLPSGIVRL